MDVAEMMVNMRATQTQSLVQFAVFKKSHEMQMELINIQSEVARSAPPPGQGTRVDKSARFGQSPTRSRTAATVGNQSGGRSWLDCVRAGEPFAMFDPDFMVAIFAAKEKVTEFNAMPVGRMLEEMAPRLRDLFGKIGDDSVVLPQLTLDVGFNI